PNIAAPGTSTRSASNTSDNAYTFADGTSMATPHIAGAMALLWSALRLDAPLGVAAPRGFTRAMGYSLSMTSSPSVRPEADTELAPNAGGITSMLFRLVPGAISQPRGFAKRRLVTGSTITVLSIMLQTLPMALRAQHIESIAGRFAWNML